MLEPTLPFASAPAPDLVRLRAISTDFEAAFLAQMLSSAGLGRGIEGFDGGIGESQMASFLVDAKARVIAERGGIGLAETVFRHLAEGANGLDHAK